MSNIVWHDTAVSSEMRQRLKSHKPLVMWYTGLSGSGKSTIANAVDKALYDKGYHSYILDGDNVRHGLNQDLTFSDEDRIENIRRISHVASLFCDAGIIVSTAFISPFIKDRALAREIIGSNFIEVYIDTPIETCESRDPKGLYKKARDGEIKNFTGLDSPYECPVSAEITIKTNELNIQHSVEKILDYLYTNKLMRIE